MGHVRTQMDNISLNLVEADGLPGISNVSN